MIGTATELPFALAFSYDDAEKATWSLKHMEKNGSDRILIHYKMMVRRVSID